MKKFFIQTFGCQMNVYDGIRISGMLENIGMTQTDIIEDADLIILNTCSVREKATNKVFSSLGRIRDKKKKNALFGIVGCVAREAGQNAFRRITELNFVLGPQSYHKLPEIIKNPDTKLLDIDLSGLEKFDELPIMTKSDLVAYIPIQEGCNHVCTYCIVPYTRGREISRPFNDIIYEVKNSVENGAIEICFLGQNVNGYKYQNYKLSDLIKEIAKISEIKRIRFTSSYPTEMTDDLIELFGKESKLLPFLNMPIQSGSQNVLTRMNRNYSIDLYIDIINKFNNVCPNIKISSDFIVGFPGESEEDFNDTLDIINKVKYINSYSFKYSPRPFTVATNFKDQIPENIKKERLKILDTRLNEIQYEFNNDCIGKEFYCLFEGMDKTKNYLVYRTPYMQQVIVKTDKIIKYVKIKIISATKSSLRGEITE